MLELDYSEFYITNTCNFNCVGCNRFNNYAFAGHYRWKDYHQIYQQWAKVLDLKTWAIMGGEPMMNPDYVDWMLGVAQLWPNSTGEFVTNGYFLQSNNQNFYEAFLLSNGKVSLGISVHNKNRVQAVLDQVLSWLVHPVSISRIPDNLNELPGIDDNFVRSYQAIKDQTWPDCKGISQWIELPQKIKNECIEAHGFSPEHLADAAKWYKIVDANNITVIIKPENFFHQASVIYSGTDFTLHNSDARKAHDVCDSKHCHHFVAGKLYKCGQVALFPEFDRQLGFNLNANDRKLMLSYTPGEPNDKLEKFLLDIDKPIDQCKFCPEKFENQEIFAEHAKKIKVKKINATIH